MSMSGNEVCEEYYNNTLPYLYQDLGKEYKPLLLAFSIILYVYVTIVFLLFVKTRNSVVYSKQKSYLAAFIYFVGMVLGITSNVLRHYLGREHFPCHALAWTHHLPTVCLLSQSVGIMYFYIYKLRMERMKTLAIKRMFNEASDNQSHAGLDPLSNTIIKSKRNESHSILFYIVDFLYVIKHSRNGIIVVGDDIDDNHDNKYGRSNSAPVGLDNKPRESTVDIIPSNPQMRQQSSEESDSRGNKSNNTFKQVFMEQVGIPLLMMAAFGFPIPIAVILRVHLDPIYRENCNGCTLTYVDYLIQLTCGALFYPLVFMGIYAMRNEQDPLRIFGEFKIATVFGTVLFISWIPSIVYSIQGTGERVILNLVEIFGAAGSYFTFVLSGLVVSMLDKRRARIQVANGIQRNRIASVIASSSHRNEYSLKNLPPPSALDLNLILLEPKARTALLEYSINEISSENVVFVFKLRAWKAAWDREKSEKLRKVAVDLFKEYISRDSKAPINISFGVYAQLEKDLEPFILNGELRSTAKPAKDLFDECEKECVKMLEHDALPRFCRSELFKKEILEGGVLEKILKQ